MAMPIIDYDFIRYHHRKLMERFQYVTDQAQHGLLEYWAGDEVLKAAVAGKTFKGDCEEFARACLLKVRERVNLKARLLVLSDEHGEGHCVCEVSSLDEREAYILDNRHGQLMPHDRLKNYRFEVASPWNPEPNDPRPWVRTA